MKMFIERLIGWLETAPDDQKAAAANALARAYLQSEMSLTERETAEATMTVLLDDPCINVRLALAKALADHPDSPRHIILALADDTVEVSVAVLMQSPALLDGELIEFVATGSVEQQTAVACRTPITPVMAAAIAEIGCYDACLAMLLNPAARTPKGSFTRIAERHGHVAELRKCLLARPDVPMAARILLIEKYAMSLLDQGKSGTIRDREKRTGELQDACDKAIITYAAQVSETELVEIVEALIASSRMNTAFLLRVICMGNIALLASAFSVLAQIPIARVERVLADDRRKAFAAIYQRAGLPHSAFAVFVSAITSWRNALVGGVELDQWKLPYLVTRQVLACYRGGGGEIVDELLLLLRRICTEAARDNAHHVLLQLNNRIAERETLQLEASAGVQLDAVNAAAAQTAVPVQDEEPQFNDNEMLEFATLLADELADAAIQQAARLSEFEDQLAPANSEPTPGLLREAA